MSSSQAEVAVGRRLVCCVGAKETEPLERLPWRTGVIRAAAEHPLNHPEQQLCVEWDGKDAIHEHQWVYLHETPEDDRHEEVGGGNFSCFLIEDRLVWHDPDKLPTKQDAKKQPNKPFRPVLTFKPLVDKIRLADKDKMPVMLLADHALIFVDKDQNGALPVQPHQTSMVVRGETVWVSSEQQKAINAWFEARRNQARLIVERDRQLIGQSVNVYWKDGTRQRWYAGCFKGFSPRDPTVTIMDYNVIQDRKVDPRLEEIQIVKDHGRASTAAPTTSPTPHSESSGRRPSRRAAAPPTPAPVPQKTQSAKRARKASVRSVTDSEETDKSETPASVSKNRKPPVKPQRKPSATPPTSRKRSISAKDTASTSKRPRGRPPGSKPPVPVKSILKPGKSKSPAKKSSISPKETKKPLPHPDEDDDDDEEPLALPRNDISSEGSSDQEEESWGLSKFSNAKKLAKSPVKKRQRSPSPTMEKVEAKLPIKKRMGRGKVESDEEKSSLEEDEESEEETSGKGKKGGRKGALGRQMTARAKKQYVSYAEDDSDEEVPEVSPVRAPSPLPLPVVKKAPSPKKEEVKPPEPVVVAPKKKGRAKKDVPVEVPEKKASPVREMKGVEKAHEEKPAAKNAPVAVAQNVGITTWPQTATKPTLTAAVTSGEPVVPKKMARVAAQPQPQTSTADFSRERERDAPDYLHRNNFHPAPPPAAASAQPAPSYPPTAPPPAPPHHNQPPVDYYPPNNPPHRYPPPSAAPYQPPYNYTPQQSAAPPVSMPPAPPPQAAAHSRQQQSGASSPFRATTPSPYVPRNSPVSNPQPAQSGASAPGYRSSGTSSPYTQGAGPQPQQQFPAGYVNPGFFYAAGTPFGAAAPGGWGAGGGVPMGAQLYPGLHLGQGGQWDASLMYPGLIPQMRASQEEQYRMAASAVAAQAANNRAVRSTATSPDLRPNSNPLTGVITGAMQALHNFQIPSPPLANACFPLGGAYQPPSSVARSSPASLPGNPLQDAAPAKPPPPERKAPAEMPAIPRQTPKLAGKKKSPSPKEKEAVSGKGGGKVSPPINVPAPVAGEPCPLTMLSAIATSMMPVATGKEKERGVEKEGAAQKAESPVESRSQMIMVETVMEQVDLGQDATGAPASLTTATRTVSVCEQVTSLASSASLAVAIARPPSPLPLTEAPAAVVQTAETDTAPHTDTGGTAPVIAAAAPIVSYPDSDEEDDEEEEQRRPRLRIVDEEHKGAGGVPPPPEEAKVAPVEAAAEVVAAPIVDVLDVKDVPMPDDTPDKLTIITEPVTVEIPAEPAADAPATAPNGAGSPSTN